MSVGRLPEQETEEIPSRCGLLLPSFLCSPVRSADMQMYVNATLQQHQLRIEEKTQQNAPWKWLVSMLTLPFTGMNAMKGVL